MSRSVWDWDPGAPMLGRWDWGSPMLQLRTAMDRLFDDFGRDLPLSRLGDAHIAAPFPRINILEDADRFILEGELPGLKMTDLEITCLGRELTIRGERTDSDDPKESFARRECPTGSFVRTVTFPAEVDAEKVAASLEDGILAISVPKAESAKPRRIAIQSSGTRTEKMGLSEKKEA